MRAYTSIIKIRFLLLLQYRMAAIAGIITQFFFGLVFVMVFDAFFSSSTSTQPLTYPQTVTYIWLGQGLLSMLPWNGDREIQGMIKTGNVAYEFCRPLDLYNHWFARLIALRIAPTLLRAIPLFTITLFFFPRQYAMQPPVSMEAFAAWALSMTGALILGCTLSNLITISTLWTIAGDGINRLFPAVVMVFSGMTVPLPFFPSWLQPILSFLPFSGLVDLPYKFYLGTLPISSLGQVLLHQITWSLILMFLGRCLINLAKKRIIVQGG